MKLLRIDASIQGVTSASTRLVDLVVDEAVANTPDLEVVSRHLAAEPIPSTAWADAVIGGMTPEESRSDAQRSAVALASSLVDELRTADLLVVASPLYNFGVSQHVKSWIDLVIAAAAPGDRILEGVPAVLVITRGGAYGPGTPREGWDHGTSYVERILADMWGADLTIVEREFTLVGVNPALDEFGDLAATMKLAAEDAASAAGRALARGEATRAAVAPDGA